MRTGIGGNTSLSKSDQHIYLFLFFYNLANSFHYPYIRYTGAKWEIENGCFRKSSFKRKDKVLPSGSLSFRDVIWKIQIIFNSLTNKLYKFK